MIEEVTRELLKKKHKDKADEVFAELALLGGWGEVGPAENQLDPGAALDLRGVLDPKNEAVSDENKAAIKALIAGVKQEDAGDKTEEKAPPQP